MKILEKAIMPNGTKIQLENWKADYPNSAKTISIAAYPVAKRDGNFTRRGETFRLGLSRNFSSDEEVRIIFKALIGGNIKLESLESHYYNGDRDSYFMGLGGDEWTADTMYT